MGGDLAPYRVAVVEDGNLVAFFHEFAGEVEANECMATALCIDDKHVVIANLHASTTPDHACYDAA